MFVKCPRCHSQVATDAVTGAPPEYCPYCDGPIAAADPDADIAPTEDDASAATAEASGDEASMAAAGASDTMPPDEISSVAVDDGSDSDAAGTAAHATIVPDEAVATTLIPSPGPNPTGPQVKPAQDTAEPAQAPSHPTGGADIDASETDRDEATVAAALSGEPAAPKRRKRATPSFVRRTVHAPRRPTPHWLWAIAGGLALLAGLQIVFADRARLAADARWRPSLAAVCEVLHCTIPPWREPAAFAMLGRDVRQHPYMPGALRVDATFRNNARWPQPWPELVLTLSDINGRALGMRTFSPQEYLDRKMTQKEIASGQSAAIRMEIMEPAPGVVSFSFDFH